jgi:hypothetical protein
MDKHPRQHKYYRLNIRIIEEVDVWRSREDSQGGPGYYSEEVLIAHGNTAIDDKALPSVIQAVTTGSHNLNGMCKNNGR